MSNREPIRTAEELERILAEPGAREEVSEGYRDGFAGEKEPGDNRSKAYWHGWRNGAVDGGHREKDAAQAELARQVLRGGYRGLSA